MFAVIEGVVFVTFIGLCLVVLKLKSKRGFASILELFHTSVFVSEGLFHENGNGGHQILCPKDKKLVRRFPTPKILNEKHVGFVIGVFLRRTTVKNRSNTSPCIMNLAQTILDKPTQ